MMMKRHGRFLQVLLASATFMLPFLACGCGEANQLFPVAGKVSYHGASLHGGTIVFVPDGDRGNNGPLASAEIQADGSYTVKTGNQEGAFAGWYRVTIMSLEGNPGGIEQSSAVPRSLVPEKFRDPQLSGLACEVRAGRDNGINFNLD